MNFNQILRRIINKFKNNDYTGYKYYDDKEYYLFWDSVICSLIQDNKVILDGRLEIL